MLYKLFEEIHLEKKLRDLAVVHAMKRTEEIVRQFVPQNAPLTPLESNYVGAIGEIAVTAPVSNSNRYSLFLINTLTIILLP